MATKIETLSCTIRENLIVIDDKDVPGFTLWSPVFRCTKDFLSLDAAQAEAARLDKIHADAEAIQAKIDNGEMTLCEALDTMEQE